MSHIQVLAMFRYANIVPKCFFVFMVEISFFCKPFALFRINVILVMQFIHVFLGESGPGGWVCVVTIAICKESCDENRQQPLCNLTARP